ncbi:DNA polymerase [Paenibacillus sp. NPDC058071]|uniref:DNA polymerase n=1 Tax=Paenibacillus sp. NPDC058071 TaxID=3346326 RepID=UPI0036DC4A66
MIRESIPLLAKREERYRNKNSRAKQAIQAQASLLAPVPAASFVGQQDQFNSRESDPAFPSKWFTVETPEQLSEMTDWLRQQPLLSIEIKTTGTNPFLDSIAAIAVYAKPEKGEEKGYCIPLIEREYNSEYSSCSDRPPILPLKSISESLRPILENAPIMLLLHNAKFGMHIMSRLLNITIIPYFDTSIAQALLDENHSSDLEEMAARYLKTKSANSRKSIIEKASLSCNSGLQAEKLMMLDALHDAMLIWELAEFQHRALNRPELHELRDLMEKVEMPFLQIVAASECRGVHVDARYLEDTVSKRLSDDLEQLRQKIWAYTGPINLNSPAQVSEAIYVKLEIPPINKFKSRSIDKNTLSKLSKKHEVIGMILTYRQKAKLLSDFAEKLPKTAIHSRIHTCFHTIGTKTGRMSSSTPNLQQIPASYDGLIRKAFTADPGRLLVSVDFNAQELRWLAHLTQDHTLLHAFKENLDIHSMTAVELWNNKHPKEPVTYECFERLRSLANRFERTDGFDSADDRNCRLTDLEQGKRFAGYREAAKTVNFGMIYGMSEYSLSEKLDIKITEARSYMKAFFSKYPAVEKWMAGTQKQIDALGYTKTFLGRKRRLYPELEAGNVRRRQAAYRMGINAVVQGSAADQLKLATIALQPYLESINAYIALWLHDEIVLSVPSSINKEQLERITEILCNAVVLDSGMTSTIKIGIHW